MLIILKELFGINKLYNILDKGTIIYIGGFELPDKNAAAHRVISNGKLLRDLGYEVVFIGVRRDGIQENLNDPQKIFDFDCYSRNYPRNILNWIKYFSYNKDYINIIEKYSDVKAIICYNMPSLPLYKLKLFCNRRSIKIISDCTEWYKNSIKNSIFIESLKRIDSILRMRYIQSKLDGIIAISEFLNRFYSMKGVNTIKIPPLVDCKEGKWNNSFAKINETIEMVYAGGAFSLKDSYVKDRLDLVVKSLSYLKTKGYKFNFKVVGCTLNDFERFYPILIDDLKILNDSIKFYGKIPHKEAINLVKTADYSIFLRDESIVTKAGFPTKFVESITCGTLVLTNSNSNVTDYLIDGENGFLIDTESLDSIKESLLVPLSLSMSEIQMMKSRTFESNIFDYRKYSNEFKKLLP